VIKDNLRANTNLRLALRMADENDSTDVLGSPQAAFFDPALPGRAVAKTGPGRLVPFQTGYAGGWTTDQPPPPDLLVEELSFGAGAVWGAAAGDGHGHRRPWIDRHHPAGGSHPRGAGTGRIAVAAQAMAAGTHRGV